MRGVMIQRSMLCYETAYKGQFRRILWRFAEDGISYAEIRLASKQLSDTILITSGRSICHMCSLFPCLNQSLLSDYNFRNRHWACGGLL